MKTDSRDNKLPTTTGVSAGADAEFDALCADYAARLPTRIAQIEQAWQELRSDWKPEKAKSFYTMIHKLAGTGATFGFPGLTEVGRAMEDGLRPLLDAGAQPTDAELAPVSASLAKLKQAAVTPS